MPGNMGIIFTGDTQYSSCESGERPISYPESSGSLVSGLVARRDSGEMEVLRMMYNPRGDSPIKMTGVLVGNFEKEPLKGTRISISGRGPN